MSESPVYTDVHRSFLQSCAYKGFMTKSNALKLLSDLYQKFDPEENPKQRLTALVEQINELIGKFDQKLCWITFDHTNEELLVFANSLDSTLTKLHSLYTPYEVEFFRLMMFAIAQSDDHKITQIDALNMVDEIKDKRSSKMKAEMLLNKWTEIGYFYIVDSIEYHLGPKGIVEFAMYLKSIESNLIRNCNLCREPIFLPTPPCENTSCSGIFHPHCLTKYLKLNKKCPECKTRQS